MFSFRNRCSHMHRLISDRVDGPISQRAERRLQAHLVRCPKCREEETFYRRIKKAAPTIESIAPPDHLWDRISVQIDIDPWGDGSRAMGISFWKHVRNFSPTGKINFAGAVLSIMLIVVLCLMPGGGIGENGSSEKSGLQAGEVDAHLEYLSLYMVANSDQFPTEVREYYLGQIEGLDQKIRMIKSALNRFPHNHRVQAQLARTYQRKLALYRNLGITDSDYLLNWKGDYYD